MFGLFDDPPTARLLLLSQSRIASSSSSLTRWKIPALCERHRQVCRELNWTVRRDGLLVSLAAERYLQLHTNNVINNNGSNGGGMKGNKQVVASKGIGDFVTQRNRLMGISKNNLLARLRELGLEDVVRLIILLL